MEQLLWQHSDWALLIIYSLLPTALFLGQFSMSLTLTFSLWKRATTLIQDQYLRQSQTTQPLAVEWRTRKRGRKKKKRLWSGGGQNFWHASTRRKAPFWCWTLQSYYIIERLREGTWPTPTSIARAPLEYRAWAEDWIWVSSPLCRRDGVRPNAYKKALPVVLWDGAPFTCP